MKKILAFILAAAMLLSLSACAKDTPQNPGTEANAAPAQTENNPSAETPDTPEPVEITFWHSYSEGEEKIFTEKKAAFRHSSRQSGDLLYCLCTAGEPVSALCRRLRERAPSGRSGGGGALVAVVVRRCGA